jgi:hypothetical protein
MNRLPSPSGSSVFLNISTYGRNFATIARLVGKGFPELKSRYPFDANSLREY